MGTDFTPTPPTSGLTLWSHDGAKHFEILGQKDIPGVPGKWVCFHSNLETFVSQLAKQEPPDSRVPNRLPPLGRGASWEMEFYVPFPIFSSGDYKDQESFRPRVGDGLPGSQ